MWINENRLSYCLDVIKEKKWTFAKTMSKNPHEYIVIDKTNEIEIFVNFFNLMEQRWYDEKYFSRIYRCIKIDGHKYWMCWSKVDKLTDTKIIINRAKLWEYS